MDVYIKRTYRGGKGGEVSPGADYNYNSVNTVVNQQYTEKSAQIATINQIVEPAVLFFSETDQPSVEDYDLYYAGTYGQHPKVMLLVFDDDMNEQEVQQVPKRYKTDNVLMRIAWDEYPLPEVCSGKIVIFK